jgi:hypothetical protein
MKSKTFKVRVNGGDESPTAAVIEVGVELANLIRKQSAALEGLGANYIHTFDSTPEYPEWDGTADMSELVVSRGEFWWQALVKHTDEHFETEAIPIQSIKSVK